MRQSAARSLSRCPERESIEEQYLIAVIACGDALNSIGRGLRMKPNGKIERERSACSAAFKALEDHERKHRCTQAKSTRESAKAGSA
jgi:hypothetical protein